MINKMKKIIKYACKALLLSALYTTTTTVQAAPACQSASSDSDGDGWGWESNASCRVVEQEVIWQECSYADADQHNGWGWNPATRESCPPRDSVVISPQPPVNDDPQINFCDYSDADKNDGWGFDPVTRQSCPPIQGPVVDVPEDSSKELGAEVIDKVILVFGQSNAAPRPSEYRSDLDYSVPNLYVYTTEDKWEVADLKTQVWQGFWYPSAGGVGTNHIAFQIGRSVAEANKDKNIGIITIGHPGQKIVCWNVSQSCWTELERRIQSALTSLGQGNKIEYAAFLQGESDEGNSSWINEFYSLFLRLQNFYNVEKIAVSETARSTQINAQINQLCSDSNISTECVSANGLNASDGVHWDADDMRALGPRFREAFSR